MLYEVQTKKQKKAMIFMSDCLKLALFKGIIE